MRFSSIYLTEFEAGSGYGWNVKKNDVTSGRCHKDPQGWFQAVQKIMVGFKVNILAFNFVGKAFIFLDATHLPLESLNFLQIVLHS